MAKRNAFDYFEAFEKVSALAVQEAEVLIETVECFAGDADVDVLIAGGAGDLSGMQIVGQEGVGNRHRTVV